MTRFAAPGPGSRPGLLASPTRNLALGLLFLAVVMAGATASYVAAGWSPGDAFYMVVITVFTVGYDEVRPVDTTLLRTITIATIVLGCTGVIFLTGALVQFITLNQIDQLLGTKRMNSQIEKLSGHIIVAGFGRIGFQLAQQLAASGGPAVLVLERDEARAQEVRALGHLCLTADATDETVLLAAGVLRAHTLATVLPNDAANVFITLSARSLNPALDIIARGDAPSTERKLLQAGATRVVLPTHIGAERIAELILFRDTARFLRGSEEMVAFEQTLRALGLNMDVVTVAAGSRAEGRTAAWLEQEAEGSFFVVQVNRTGEPAQTRPEPSHQVAAGDGLVLIGRNLGSRALFDPAGRTGG